MKRILGFSAATAAKMLAAKTMAIAAAAVLAAAIMTGCMDAGLSDYGPSSSAEGSSSTPGSNDNGPQAGTLTAGEWCDLANWDFWTDLLKKDKYAGFPDYWRFYTDRRVAVDVKTTDNQPVANAKVAYKEGEATKWEARTSNTGRAELWPGLRTRPDVVDNSGPPAIWVNDAEVQATLDPATNVWQVTLPAAPAIEPKIELAFMVDATGSMSDELEFLKAELLDVVNRVEGENPNAAISTAAVYYRDVNDDYVTRVHDFSTDISTTYDFISDQRAEGGGDREEAVHTALDKTVNELQWSDETRTKILFILLDAPPHYEVQIIDDIHRSIGIAARKGIRVIPIAASGVDVQTEFLLRFMAIATNGTYVFLTDHSGVGNPHLDPSVGTYEVELLNDLMVRLINEYAK